METYYMVNCLLLFILIMLDSHWIWISEFYSAAVSIPTLFVMLVTLPMTAVSQAARPSPTSSSSTCPSGWWQLLSSRRASLLPGNRNSMGFFPGSSSRDSLCPCVFSSGLVSLQQDPIYIWEIISSFLQVSFFCHCYWLLEELLYLYIWHLIMTKCSVQDFLHLCI